MLGETGRIRGYYLFVADVSCLTLVSCADGPCLTRLVSVWFGLAGDTKLLG
jgi:hypothetical protein